VQAEVSAAPSLDRNPGRCAAHRQRRRRLYAYVLIEVSLALLVFDVIVNLSQGTDVLLEAAARLGVIGVAYLAIRRSAHEYVWLLIWGLILTSFDTFWAAPGEHWAPLRDAMMILKYTAFPVGLVFLTRFTAEFGGPGCDVGRIRNFVRVHAWPLGVALAIAGLGHGITFLQGCLYSEQSRDFTICPQRTLDWYDAYLLIDVMMRVGMIVAAIAGLYVARRTRARFVVLSVACMIFAFGTALDFIARVFPSLPVVGALDGKDGALIDALSTVAFPIGLLVAIGRSELYDVKYLLHRGAVVTAVATLLSGVWYTLQKVIEHTLHFFFTHETATALGAEHEVVRHAIDAIVVVPHAVIDVILGVVVTLLYKPLDRTLSEIVERKIFPDRGKRLRALRRCIEDLPAITEVHALEQLMMKTAIHCGTLPFSFFKPKDEGCFAAVVPRDDNLDASFAADDHCVAMLAEGKMVKSGVGRVFPGAVIAAPVVLGGKLRGVLVSGPPLRYEPQEFVAEEERELVSLAREAGAALLALGVLAV